MHVDKDFKGISKPTLHAQNEKASCCNDALTTHSLSSKYD